MRHVRHGLPGQGPHHLLAGLILLAACAGDSTDKAAETAATYRELHDSTFFPSCGFSVCHGSGAGGLTISEDAEATWERLVDVPATGAPSLDLVVSGDSADSYLVHKLEGAEGIVGDRMPEGTPLDADTLAAIREWIDAGALLE